MAGDTIDLKKISEYHLEKFLITKNNRDISSPNGVLVEMNENGGIPENTLKLKIYTDKRAGM